MKLRVSLSVFVAIALLVGFTASPGAPQAEASKDRRSAGKKAAGKKQGSARKCGAKGKGKKKGLAKKKGSGKGCSGKKGAGKKVGSGPKGPGSKVRGDDGCPRGASECIVSIILRQASPISGGSCDSFDNDSGFCVGPTGGTKGWDMPTFFPRQGFESSFTWTATGGGARDADYTANAQFTIVEAYIRGNVPSSNSATFNVTDAWNRTTDTHWKTRSTGAAPGTPGGPLYLNYSHGIVDSYVHIFGYMVPR